MTQGVRGRSGQGVDDPFWQDIDEGESVVVVMMNGGHVRAYQRWLRSHGLHLFAIPASEGPNGLPVYSVGVREELLPETEIS